MRNGTSHSVKPKRMLAAIRWELGHSLYLKYLSSRMANKWLHSLACFICLPKADITKALSLPVAKLFCCIALTGQQMISLMTLLRRETTPWKCLLMAAVGVFMAQASSWNNLPLCGSEARRCGTIDLILCRIFIVSFSSKIVALFLSVTTPNFRSHQSSAISPHKIVMK